MVQRSLYNRAISLVRLARNKIRRSQERRELNFSGILATQERLGNRFGSGLSAGSAQARRALAGRPGLERVRRVLPRRIMARPSDRSKGPQLSHNRNLSDRVGSGLALKPLDRWPRSQGPLLRLTSRGSLSKVRDKRHREQPAPSQQITCLSGNASSPPELGRHREVGRQVDQHLGSRGPLLRLTSRGSLSKG